MNEETYIQRRKELEREFFLMRSRRCYLSAKARIRKIADLDYQFKGTDKEVTKQRYNYYNINKMSVLKR